eukprot:tig00020556_g11017.t1
MRAQTERGFQKGLEAEPRVHAREEPQEDVPAITDAVRTGKWRKSAKVDLVYVTPEKLAPKRGEAESSFVKNLKEAHRSGLVNGIVVDECHCVIEWGSTFRPAYEVRRGRQLLRRGAPFSSEPNRNQPARKGGARGGKVRA